MVYRVLGIPRREIVIFFFEKIVEKLKGVRILFCTFFLSQGVKVRISMIVVVDMHSFGVVTFSFVFLCSLTNQTEWKYCKSIK